MRYVCNLLWVVYLFAVVYFILTYSSLISVNLTTFQPFIYNMDMFSGGSYFLIWSFKLLFVFSFFACFVMLVSLWICEKNKIVISDTVDNNIARVIISSLKSIALFCIISSLFFYSNMVIQAIIFVLYVCYIVNSYHNRNSNTGLKVK